MSDNNAQSAAGYAAPTDYSWIGDIVYQALMSQAEMAQMRQASQADPCGMAAYLREILIGPQGLERLDSKWTAVRQKAQLLPITIQDSIERRGNLPPGSDLSGGKRLAEFAFETLGPARLIPSADRAGLAFASGFLPPLVALAEMQWIEDRMPSGQSIANGTYLTRLSNTGERVSSGVYIKNGTYRGTEIGRLIIRWINYQIENVSSPALGNARSDLIRMVGTFKGSGQFGIWQESDGVRSGSELANIIFTQSEIVRLEEESRLMCNQFNTAEQQRMDAIVGSHIQSQLSDAQTRSYEAQATQRRNNLATVAALMLGAFAAMRLRR